MIARKVVLSVAVLVFMGGCASINRNQHPEASEIVPLSEVINAIKSDLHRYRADKAIHVKSSRCAERGYNFILQPESAVVTLKTVYGKTRNSSLGIGIPVFQDSGASIARKQQNDRSQTITVPLSILEEKSTDNDRVEPDHGMAVAFENLRSEFARIDGNSTPCMSTLPGPDKAISMKFTFDVASENGKSLSFNFLPVKIGLGSSTSESYSQEVEVSFRMKRSDGQAPKFIQIN